jgi:hypothetical protein
MAGILCDQDFYTRIRKHSALKLEVDDCEVAIEEMRMLDSRRNELETDVKSLKNTPVPSSLESRYQFLPKQEVVFSCMLDEMLFYMTRLGYPQMLVNFLLHLLPNDKFKVRLECNQRLYNDFLGPICLSIFQTLRVD